MYTDHLNRYVSNVDAMISFYADALGFTLLDRGVKANGKPYAILQGADFELFISEKDGFAADTASNFRHIGLCVHSADEYLEDLKAKGYMPQDARIIVKAFSRQFYVKDPDGFEIDIIQWTDKDAFYRHLKTKMGGGAR